MQTDEIRPRRVHFDLHATPLHFVPGDPQTTHTINVLHLLLPAGERWFVRVYRQALSLVTDEKLLAQVRGFMGQEATHASAHAAWVQELAERGLEVAPFLQRVDRLFERLLGDRPLGASLSPSLERRWLLARLGLIATIEHYTCVLGVWVLNARALDEAGADANMMDLLRWHGAEEVEHRSIAFDLYRHVGGGYALRCMAALAVLVVLPHLFYWGTRELMAADPTRPGPASWRSFADAGRRGILPRAGQLLGALPRFLRPGYHPEHEASTEQALQYLAGSPSVRAA